MSSWKTQYIVFSLENCRCIFKIRPLKIKQLDKQNKFHKSLNFETFNLLNYLLGFLILKFRLTFYHSLANSVNSFRNTKFGPPFLVTWAACQPIGSMEADLLSHLSRIWPLTRLVSTLDLTQHVMPRLLLSDWLSGQSRDQKSGKVTSV